MNQYFIEKYKQPEIIETIANPPLIKGMKPLLDKFNDLLAIDVYFYTGMLKTNLICETGHYTIVDVELEIMNDLINSNPTTHKNFKKKNKKGLRLLIEHYNNLLDVPSDKSVYSGLYDTMWDLDVDIGHIYLLLAIIHVTIALNMESGINLIKATDKVFKDEIESKDDLINREVV